MEPIHPARAVNVERGAERCLGIRFFRLYFGGHCKVGEGDLGV